MSLKSATLIAIIGEFISLLWAISINIGVLNWNRAVSVVISIIGTGSLLIFLVTLYLKQNK
jgi:hypothetical protein